MEGIKRLLTVRNVGTGNATRSGRIGCQSGRTGAVARATGFALRGLPCLLLATAVYGAGDESRESSRVQPWAEDGRYWQYRGEPVLLIGGSDQDNLFNHPDIGEGGLEAHLDLLVSVGGNYVRNTMSSRDAGNLWPHAREEGGLYDLDRFNEAYWERFEHFLRMTAERGIIVQIEMFDRFDYARAPWEDNPFNPKNNINYTSEEIGLPETIDSHPGRLENPFFRSTPEQEDNSRLLAHQETLVERILSISLQYGHVLYCISNETNESEHWSGYWARFIRERADEAGVGVEVTEMWDPWDLSHPMHRHTFDHPDLYSFVDTSQNNHQTEQTHWDNMQWVRQYVADPGRPVNNVKIYGGTPHGGGLLEGTHKFWRNLFGGLASSRFHRPDSGAGLSELAQTHLRSANLFLEEVDLLRCEPNNDLLSERGENEAYCTAVPGEIYAVYFTDGGSVNLDVEPAQGGEWSLRWLEISESQWTGAERVNPDGVLELSPPGEGQWAAVLRRED